MVIKLNKSRSMEMLDLRGELKCDGGNGDHVLKYFNPLDMSGI